MSKPILILDDDNHFRQLLTGMFQARGYQVFECRSAKEASAAFAETDPCLAIVDYRLPESDGISWITWLRESGRNFPVIFCSGTWCDEKTFTWLRNILRVSLILRKPIVPELFMQQIENLLPPPSVSVVKEEIDLSMPAKPYVAPVTADDLTVHIARIDEAISKSSSESATYNQLVAMRSKLVVQQMLAEAKQAYALDLPDQWKALSEAVAQLQAEPDNKIALDDSMQHAHRMRGTAGAMGFHSIGMAAGKIEDLLRRFDPTDTLTEVLWTEVFRALTEGELFVRALATEIGIALPSKVQQFDASVLIFGSPANFAEQVKELNNENIEAIVHDELLGAKAAAKGRRFDSAIFDLSQASYQDVFDLAGSVREAQRGKPIPLTFISAGQESPDEASMAYAGCSSFLWSPVPPRDLFDTVQKSVMLAGSQKSKILTVDDDDALTRFIQTILTGEGLVVEALNKPIQILSKVEQFQPDLILLDVMMPGLSGYDVCRLLRATDNWAEVPILFLTSKSDADGRAAAFHAGATDFLSKPILAPELVSRVQAHLGKVKRNANAQNSGLLNRKEFIDAAKSMVADAASSREEIAVCLLLIDDLLNLNIAHGVSGVEIVENTLGELLRIHFKAESLRAIWGEGGFALTVPNESKHVIAEAINKLLADFRSITFVNEDQQDFKSTFTAGISGVPGDDVTIENLMNLANIRMTRARQSKPGSVISSGT